jgi:hypothetical protein
VWQDAAFLTSMPEKLEPLRIEITAALDAAGYRYTKPPAPERKKVEKKVIDACAKFNKALDTEALTRFLKWP